MSTERRWLTVAAFAGKVLFFCLFFPAVQTCGQAVYPCELDNLWAWSPYLLGIGVTAWAWLGVTQRRVPVWLAITLIVYALLQLLAVGVAVVWGSIASSPAGLVCLAPWLVLAVLSLPTLSRRRPLPWRAARAVWLGTATSAAWFLLWIIAPAFDKSDDHALWGMYVAAASALTITAIAAVQERRERPPVDGG